jgi:cysteinyl-tRNA synthetase
MDDDFNTPEAVAVLFDLANEVNRNQSAEATIQLKALAGVLGLLQRNSLEYLQGNSHATAYIGVVQDDQKTEVSMVALDINALIDQRITAKKAKNFAEADRIRKMLLEVGIVLEDTPQGTTWRRA